MFARQCTCKDPSCCTGMHLCRGGMPCHSCVGEHNRYVPPHSCPLYRVAPRFWHAPSVQPLAPATTQGSCSCTQAHQPVLTSLWDVHRPVRAAAAISASAQQLPAGVPSYSLSTSKLTWYHQVHTEWVNVVYNLEWQRRCRLGTTLGHAHQQQMPHAAASTSLRRSQSPKSPWSRRARNPAAHSWCAVQDAQGMLVVLH